MAAAGGGREEPEKASIYKAPHPSSTLQAGSHSRMGEPIGLPLLGKARLQGSSLPAQEALQALGRSGARGPMVAENQQIRFSPDVGDRVAAMPIEGQVPPSRGSGAIQGAGLGPGISTGAGITVGAMEQHSLLGTLSFLVNSHMGIGLLCGAVLQRTTSCKDKQQRLLLQEHCQS